MTRKDYELIADAIYEAAFATFIFANTLAGPFQRDNPKFDRDKFIKRATEGKS